MELPDSNPKSSQGRLKAPLRLVPPAAIIHLAEAFADGAVKYGPYNWREKGVAASVYYEAQLRHLMAWWDGEDLSRDALKHHLSHTMACCAIMLDAMEIGKLIDDRPPTGSAADLLDQIHQTNLRKETE